MAKKKKYGRRWTGTEILDNLVTFGSVISVYPFPFFSNIINGNVYTEGIFSAVKKIYGERVRAHKVENMCLEAKRKFWSYQVIKRYADEKLKLFN